MQNIEERLRSELVREQQRIDALRRDPSLLTRRARRHPRKTLAMLEAAWTRARDALEGLTRTTSNDADHRDTEHWGEEFGLAWRQLKSELRGVATS